MSRPGALGAVCYEAESAWGEDVTTFATRLPVLDAVDLSGLTQEKIEPGRVMQYRNDGVLKISGPMGGTFKTKFWLAGHGSTTSGATSATSVPTLLGYVLGAVATGVSGTTASAGTATALTTAASGTFAAGQLGRLGAKADTKGDGQWFATSTHVTTTLTVLTTCAGAPTSSDVVYSAETVYTAEAAAGSVTGLRFLLQTANHECEAHGCYASAISIGGLNAGEVPFCEVTWTVSWWRFSTATFPSAVSVESFTPAPVGAGSFYLQVNGTATRATRNVRNVSVDIKLGIEPLMGPNGVNAYQACVGAVRTPNEVTITWEEDSETATASPVLAGYWDGSSAYHLLYSLSTVAGSAMAIYIPRGYSTGARPNQMGGAVNRVKLSLAAHTSSVTTSELTLSAFRLGFA